MPNWCSNRVTISGPEGDLAAFLSDLQEHFDEKEPNAPYSLMESFLPMPDDIGDGWHAWAMDNWGTKWADRMMVAYIDPTQIVLMGDTPWCPPLEGLNTISKMHPTLTFVAAWDEPGMCFLGAARFANGLSTISEVTNDDYPSYETDDGNDVANFDGWRSLVEQAIDSCVSNVS